MAKRVLPGLQFFEWSVFDKGRSYSISDIHFSGEKIRDLLANGRLVENWSHENYLTLSERYSGPNNHHLSFSTSLRVVSPELKCLLLNEVPAEDVQFLPVRIEPHPDGTCLSGYSVMNVIRWIDCVDWSQTPSKMVAPGGEREVNMLAGGSAVLSLSKIPDDAMLFRVKGWYVGTVLRGTIVKRLKEAGFKTLDLSKLGVSDNGSAYGILS